MSVRASQRTQSTSGIGVFNLMLFRKMFLVCFKNYTEHKNTAGEKRRNS